MFGRCCDTLFGLNSTIQGHPHDLVFPVITHRTAGRNVRTCKIILSLITAVVRMIVDDVGLIHDCVDNKVDFTSEKKWF